MDGSGGYNRRQTFLLRSTNREGLGIQHHGEGGLARREKYAASLGVPKLAPHDLRRSCARFCHAAGGELEQIQFLLGHVSVQTTERYLGCKQRLWGAVNDRIGIEPQ